MELKKEISPFAKLGEVLVAQGTITDTQLQKALSEQKFSGTERLGDIMLRLGYAVEEQLFSAVAHQMSTPFITNDKMLEAKEEAVRVIPEAFARQNTLIAYAIDDKKLYVAMADPEDIIAIDNIRKLSEKTIVPALATQSGIKQAIEQLYVRIRKAGEVQDVIGTLQIFTESDSDEDGMVDMTKADTSIKMRRLSSWSI